MQSVASVVSPPSDPLGNRDPRTDLRTALGTLLVRHGGRTTLSAWERHCLGQALTLLRYGYYEPARIKVEMMLQPPHPLPTFPLPRPLSLEDVRRALTQL